MENTAYTYHCSRHFIYEGDGDEPVGIEAVTARVELLFTEGNVAHVRIVDGSSWRSVGKEFKCLRHDLNT